MRVLLYRQRMIYLALFARWQCCCREYLYENHCRELHRDVDDGDRRISYKTNVAGFTWGCKRNTEMKTHFSARRYAFPSLQFFDPSAGTQFQAGSQSTRTGKNCHFRLKSPFILETVRDTPFDCYRTLIVSHWWRIDLCPFR